MISASSSKGLVIVVWILQVLMGCLFIFAGFSKLVGVTEMVNFFAQAGFGQWLRYALGVLEFGSAVALFFPVRLSTEPWCSLLRWLDTSLSTRRCSTVLLLRFSYAACCDFADRLSSTPLSPRRDSP